MSILSVTFHTINSEINNWEIYVKDELSLMIENLYDVEKYILSDVHSEMITEGKNTNLLLVFDNAEKRSEFINIELVNISERIAAKFGENVMIFKTELNEIQSRF